jgi:hypothetical protein
VFHETHLLYRCSKIQSVPGGKANIVGGLTISCFKQKLYTYMCHFPKGFRDQVISLRTSQIVDKVILRTVSNIDIYYSSDKVGKVYLV